MSFKVWMRRNYYNGVSDKGDLARHIWADEKFPLNGKGKYNGWHSLFADYLRERGTEPFVMEIFEQCWEEYVVCEKGKSSRRSAKL